MSMNRNKVAELAGVSPVTVSRVFRNSSLVDPKTRKRVLEAGRKCGYVPNSAARAIRQGRFNRVAAVVVQYGDVGTSWFPNNGFLDPAVNELAIHSYSMVTEPLYLDIKNDVFHQPPRLFSELAVDGILGRGNRSAESRRASGPIGCADRVDESRTERRLGVCRQR